MTQDTTGTPSHRVRGAASAALCLLLLALLAGSAGAAAQVFAPGQVSARTLDNGLRVIVKEGHSAPIVAVDVYIRYGSGLETAETNGAAHGLEHMVFQGREENRVGRLPRLVEGMGGTVVAETTRDHTHFMATASSEHFDQIVTQLALAIRSPEMDQATVTREMSIIVSELMEQNDNPLARMLDATYDLAFEKQGYGLPTGGTADSIQGLGRPDLQRAHDTYYTGPNMAVVVVGDVDTARAHQIVGEAFGAFPGGEPADDTVAAEWQPEETALDLDVPDARPLFMIGFPGPAISVSKLDVCAADVIMAIVSEGRQSLFAKHAEDHEGLLGSASCMYLTQQHPGLFYIWGVAAEDQLDASVEAVFAIITDLRVNGITEEQLQYGKDLIVGSYAVQSETYPDQAGTLGFYECIDSYEFAVDYEELVRAVTMEDVERVLQTYLDPAKHTLVRILP